MLTIKKGFQGHILLLKWIHCILQIAYGDSICHYLCKLSVTPAYFIKLPLLMQLTAKLQSIKPKYVKCGRYDH